MGVKCTVRAQSSHIRNNSSETFTLNANTPLVCFTPLVTFSPFQALANARRRKRETTRLTTICEPRFIISAPDSALILIWLCPEGEDVPSPEAQQRLCAYLFELGVVGQCKLPFAEEFMTPPTVPPLPTTRSVMCTFKYCVARNFCSFSVGHWLQYH